VIGCGSRGLPTEELLCSRYTSTESKLSLFVQRTSTTSPGADRVVAPPPLPPSDSRLTLAELGKPLGSHAINGIGWHDENEDGAVTLDEFIEGFAFWSGVTHSVIAATPEKVRKFQLHGTIENLEDLPPNIAKKALKDSLKMEASAAKSEL